MLAYGQHPPPCIALSQLSSLPCRSRKPVWPARKNMLTSCYMVQAEKKWGSRKPTQAQFMSNKLDTDSEIAAHPTISPAWMSPTDFEHEYLVKESTQSAWRCTGRYALPHYKVGRLIRYKRCEIEQWLQGRAAGVVQK